jgi:ABC-type phosphate transport system substrate-binding protein
MRSRTLIAVLLFSVVAEATPFTPVVNAAEPAAFKVVVNEGNITSTVNRHDLSAIFLKKKFKWADGATIEPIDQPSGSDIRENFSTLIHHRNSQAVTTFWRQQIFSGRNVPPPVKKSDAEVIQFVKANPRAIGYVSMSALTAGVKVLSTEE